MKLDFSNEFNDDLNIRYYQDRIESILASIESMINDYSEYITGDEINDKRECVQKKKKEYIIESIKTPVNKEKLAKIVTEVFDIEESLINLSSKIWNGETKKGKIVLFHTPANEYNLREKGFRSTTVLFVNPNEDSFITNDTFRSREFGEGYELEEGENIILGNSSDISSGIFGKYEKESHIDHFEIKQGNEIKNVWSISGSSRICTPLQAARTFNPLVSYLHSINEIIIATSLDKDSKIDKKLKCMIFSGRLEGYVLLKLYMEEIRINLPIKPICINPLKKIDVIGSDNLYDLGGAYSYGVDTEARKNKIDKLCEEYYVFMKEYVEKYGEIKQIDMNAMYEDRGKEFECTRILGVTEEVYRCEKPSRIQRSYLFKPAQSKEGNPEPFRAFIQEAAYCVQQIIDKKMYYSPILCEVCTVNINGKKVFGTMYEEIPIQYDAKTLKSGKLIELIKEDPKIERQLIREFIVDYLLCNFDSQVNNFIIDEKGVLRGVDKENSFKHLQEVDDDIDITYYPNDGDVEQESIYNTIFRMYQLGEIDLDFGEYFEEYINTVERVNNYQYMEIFRPYAESLYGKGSKESEALLKRIMERKMHLREACLDLIFNLRHNRAKFDRENLNEETPDIEKKVPKRRGGRLL